MEQEDIIQMLQRLGCGKIKTNYSGNVLSTCPFSKDHKNGTDNNPSFTIEITPAGEKSRWNCFGCGAKGQSLKSFARKVWEELRIDLHLPEAEGPREYTPKIELSRDWMPKGDKWYRQKKPLLLNFDDFSIFYEEFPQYAIDRGMTREQIAEFKIGWDRGRQRLFLPIFDTDRTMVGWSTRASRPEQKPKYFHCPGFPKEHYLYGEHLWDTTLDIVCLSEGFFDVYKMAEAGIPNPCAFFGQGVGSTQVYKIMKRFKRAIIFPHNDKPNEKGVMAGIRMAEEWRDALVKAGLEVRFAPVIRGKKDVGEWSIEEIRYVWNSKIKFDSLPEYRIRHPHLAGVA